MPAIIQPCDSPEACGVSFAFQMSVLFTLGCLELNEFELFGTSAELGVTLVEPVG